MTDKELKKLSRLELLELLLEASKENNLLKLEIEKQQKTNQTTQSIESLSAITQQVLSALRYANTLTDKLKNKTGEVASPFDNTSTATCVKLELSDREIYWRMLFFFAQNADKLDIFPNDIKNDIKERIKSVLKKEI